MRVGEITLPKIQGWLDQLKAEGNAKDTCWGHGQRVRSFVKYLVDQRLLRPSILENFTVPEQASVGRKNWVRKDNVTKLLEAASYVDACLGIYQPASTHIAIYLLDPFNGPLFRKLNTSSFGYFWQASQSLKLPNND